jgi:hypothetical protein
VPLDTTYEMLNFSWVSRKRNGRNLKPIPEQFKTLKAMKKLLLIIIVLLSGQQLFSQCFPDRHNTSWYDGWVSCEITDSPNPERGQSHWILYNFGQPYVMNQMHVWNANDPAHLDRGINEVIIDYSNDGVQWTELGSFNFEQASGHNTYEGFDGPDFDEAEAQYVLITAVSNFGGDCYGMSEVRFGVAGPVVAMEEPEADSKWCLNVLTYPNPFVRRTNLEVTNNCEEDVYYSITNSLGKVILSEQLIDQQGPVALDFEQLQLPAGIYFLGVRKGVITKQYKLIRLRE